MLISCDKTCEQMYLIGTEFFSFAAFLISSVLVHSEDAGHSFPTEATIFFWSLSVVMNLLCQLATQGHNRTGMYSDEI